MEQIELNSLTEFLSEESQSNLEPVLQYVEKGGWSLAFQKIDVGFPFKEFHFVVVDSAEPVALPIDEWFTLFEGVEHVKLDLRHVELHPRLDNYQVTLNEVSLTCANCGLSGQRNDFVRAKDLLERVDLGDAFSDSECPECGALAFPAEKNVPSHWIVMEMFMRKIDEFQSNLGREEAMYDLSKLAMTLAMLPTEEAIQQANELLIGMAE